MRFLVIEPPEEDISTAKKYRRELKAELQNSVGRVRLSEVDAHPGASWPALFIDFANYLALILALYATPDILEKNTPKWKAKLSKLKADLDKAVNVFRRRKLKFFIDTQTAKDLAKFYALNKTSGGYSKISFVSVVKHSLNNHSYVEDVTEIKQRRKNRREQNNEAVSLVRSRHIICLAVDEKYFTVIIEHDGRCSYIKSLDRM